METNTFVDKDTENQIPVKRTFRKRVLVKENNILSNSDELTKEVDKTDAIEKTEKIHIDIDDEEEPIKVKEKYIPSEIYQALYEIENDIVPGDSYIGETIWKGLSSDEKEKRFKIIRIRNIEELLFFLSKRKQYYSNLRTEIELDCLIESKPFSDDDLIKNILTISSLEQQEKSELKRLAKEYKEEYNEEPLSAYDKIKLREKSRLHSKIGWYEDLPEELIQTSLWEADINASIHYFEMEKYFYEEEFKSNKSDGEYKEYENIGLLKAVLGQELCCGRCLEEKLLKYKHRSTRRLKPIIFW